MPHKSQKILKDFLSIDDPSDWQQFTVSAEELGHFLVDPKLHNLQLVPSTKLDTSADNASVMCHSPWNQAVILLLAAKAEEQVSEDHSYYGAETDKINWVSLFKDQIYRLFSEVVQAQAGQWDYTYEAKKLQSKKRRLCEYSFKHCTQIASVMTTLMHSLQDDEQYDCWLEILYSLGKLGTEGMSDSEEVLDTKG
ncbi:hypothetical protein GYMLUDRAFT_65099 [Collybiopsis luxurians FD-317 M1]|uniref:Uncharacterized protein n=1 Tax=Collybiopsis luxurians FD-317 M1 TaxID=944289 RepID=A0A0D0C836_9AGAR|nr:hypothetical protein GYMLUDRAFT_65099 [Collybiopsis luxurians FD-317 M1]